MYVARTFFLAAFVAAGALPAVAQDESSVRLVGRVIDDTMATPVANAHVVTRNRNGGFLAQTLTDEDGRFDLRVPNTSGAWITASRTGYEQTEPRYVFFDGSDFLQVELRMHPEAVLLAPLEVVARTGNLESPVFDNFERRLESGLGTYFTRGDILERDPLQVTDVLRTVSGLRVASSGTGRHSVLIGRQGCPMQVFLDGMQVSQEDDEGVAIDDVVSPLDVEGIEIYRGLSTVPAEFLNERADCGVVAIWTRRGR